MQHVTLVITDLDNTLYDWFGAWHKGFRAMLDELARISGIPEAALLPEIKAVHERYGTSEYAFLIEELPSLRGKRSPAELQVEYASAIEAYRDGRRSILKPYEGVMETLAAMRRAGTVIVGYTESRWYYARRRLKRLGLDELLDCIYSPPDHDLPRSREDIRQLPKDEYVLKHVEHRVLPEGEMKPNPAVLREILRNARGARHETIYIGDDLVKDVSMAKEAGVTAVWAEYGSHKDSRYDLLMSVTHWTSEAVRKQQIATSGDHNPDVTISRFDELLSHFTFGRPIPEHQ